MNQVIDCFKYNHKNNKKETFVEGTQIRGKWKLFTWETTRVPLNVSERRNPHGGPCLIRITFSTFFTDIVDAK